MINKKILNSFLIIPLLYGSVCMAKSKEELASESIETKPQVSFAHIIRNYNKKPLCAATFIKDNFLLSSEFCFRNFDRVDAISVKAYIPHHPEMNNVNFKIVNIISPPKTIETQKKKQFNNIVLLKVEPVEPNNNDYVIKPIAISKFNSWTEDPFTAPLSTFINERDYLDSSDQHDSKEFNLNLSPTAACKQSDIDIDNLEQFLCISEQQNDAGIFKRTKEGLPLIIKQNGRNELAGIKVRYNMSVNEMDPAWFVKLSYFADWIEQMIEDHSIATEINQLNLTKFYQYNCPDSLPKQSDKSNHESYIAQYFYMERQSNFELLNQLPHGLEFGNIICRYKLPQGFTVEVQMAIDASRQTYITMKINNEIWIAKMKNFNRFVDMLCTETNEKFQLTEFRFPQFERIRISMKIGGKNFSVDNLLPIAMPPIDNYREIGQSCRFGDEYFKVYQGTAQDGSDLYFAEFFGVSFDLLHRQFLILNVD